jgi:iron-sulfur cluster assembly protein
MEAEHKHEMPTAEAPKGITVTEKAIEHIKLAMQKENIAADQGGLRLGVQGGGCSGLSYVIKFDTQPRDRDRVFMYGDVRVFVDPKSFIYLHGMVLDWEETLMQRGFVFSNPNAKKSCGCGTSFS